MVLHILFHLRPTSIKEFMPFLQSLTWGVGPDAETHSALLLLISKPRQQVNKQVQTHALVLLLPSAVREHFPAFHMTLYESSVFFLAETPILARFPSHNYYEIAC